MKKTEIFEFPLLCVLKITLYAFYKLICWWNVCFAGQPHKHEDKEGKKLKHTILTAKPSRKVNHRLQQVWSSCSIDSTSYNHLWRFENPGPASGAQDGLSAVLLPLCKPAWPKCTSSLSLSPNIVMSKNNMSGEVLDRTTPANEAKTTSPLAKPNRGYNCWE